MARGRHRKRSRGVAGVHRSGIDPVRPHLVEHVVEARKLLRGVRVRGLVGNGEVRERARESELAVRDHVTRQVEGVRGAAPDAVHPGIDLEVDVERQCGAGCRDRFGERVDPAGGVHDRGQTALHDGLGRVGHRLGEHEDRRVDARVAQLDTFLDERDAEHRDARVDRGSTRPGPRRGRSHRP